MPPPPDTIAAISTPPGHAGIGIVRLSGPDAHPLALRLLHRSSPLTPRRATVLPLPDPEAPDSPTPLDQVVATLFPAPGSYTGDDIVEISAHGSPVVLHAILRFALAHGARLAEPGEFTHRAFLAGKLDLTEAEAVHDLIASTTLHQARVAAAQLAGSLSATIAPVKEQLLTLIATLEAGIDFAEDDIDTLPASAIAEALHAITTPLLRLQSTFGYGNLLRGGLPLAIVGAPNTGKSSLFNALLGRDRAIVTPIPGTTRDLLSEPLSLHGIPVELTDTAGLRSTTEPIEALGIARSRSALAEAAAILLVLDASHPPLPQDLAPLHALLQDLKGRPFLLVVNKLDLTNLSAPELAERFRSFIAASSSQPVSIPNPTALETPPLPAPTSPSPSRQPAPPPGLTVIPAIPAVATSIPTRPSLVDPTPAPASRDLSLDLQQLPIVPISALTGEGLSQLRSTLHSLLTGGARSQDTTPITSLRQQAAITASLTALTTAAQALPQSIPHEMLLLDLHAALDSLDSLTGTTTTDDILHRIFSTFCIGK